MPSLPGSGPLIVTGMHRSATSLTASWLTQLGICMGQRLVPGDAANPVGYYEDTAFLTLNRRMLAAACDPAAGGHADWGWTGAGGPDPAALEAFRPEAGALVAEQAAQAQLWGWKDPRTTMLLPFWDSVVPDARYLLLYRYPWEVSASIHRLAPKRSRCSRTIRSVPGSPTTARCSSSSQRTRIAARSSAPTSWS